MPTSKLIRADAVQRGRAPSWDHRNIYFRSNIQTAQRSHALAIYIILIGICMPTIQFVLAGAKFTPGRIAVFLLLVPGLVLLVQERRRLIAADLFACATSIWILIATAHNAEAGGLNSAFAEALEFFGAYLVGRAYVFGPPALQTFIRALKAIAVVVLMGAIVDILSGRNLVREETANLFPIALYINNAADRLGIVRPASTFDGPIQLGVFFTVVLPIFLYSARNRVNLMLFGGIAFIGCLSTLSSGPLLTSVFVIACFLYDMLMRRYSWRWKALVLFIALPFFGMFMVSKTPFARLIDYLTIDPSSGYYRIQSWRMATSSIAASPLVGYGFGGYGDINDYFSRASVDSVWLVCSLRFGLPMVFFLFLTILCAFYQFGRNPRTRVTDPYLGQITTGFTSAILAMALAGLTVHFWNSIWILWGLCIGIRASLKEYSITQPLRPNPYSQDISNSESRFAEMRRVF